MVDSMQNVEPLLHSAKVDSWIIQSDSAGAILTIHLWLADALGLNLRGVSIHNSASSRSNIPRAQRLTRLSRQNRGASLAALDDEYSLVVNDISFTDLL